MCIILDAIRSKKFMTFDCYGTLIDWESGILDCILPVLGRHNIEATEEDVLARYAKFEMEIERDEFVNYRTVLKRVMTMFLSEFQFQPVPNEDLTLVEGIKHFEPFADTVEALRSLRQRYQLGVISNVDQSLFRFTAEKLKIEFPFVITSEEVGSYKPSAQNFIHMLEVMGATAEEVVHVAQSTYHDLVPASSLGITTVQVTRSNRRGGVGAAPELDGRADIVVNDLRTLVKIIEIC